MYQETISSEPNFSSKFTKFQNFYKKSKNSLFGTHKNNRNFLTNEDNVLKFDTDINDMAANMHMKIKNQIGLPGRFKFEIPGFIWAQ